ncbi:MAG TPA: class I SAM-dependent methyltransferase [Sporichthyaceae bacterium]|jgi:SAM-dependent methyltransferase|nr:class I SAM-dependent methyltransferase [Sporichthyaceae bacterium]
MTTVAPPTDADFAALRPFYRAEIAAGIDRFVGPRRSTCPWCGSGRLHTRTRLPDLVQRKPGRFAFDECRTCGHVFQNPSLTPEGLAFYYRDFYDGLGASTTETFFSWQTEIYRSRARSVAPFCTPRRWLDIGTGYGHFCKDAKEVLPGTIFAGLDQGAAVEEGHRRGWLDQAHRGELAELATELTGRYDVISMFHYLEHLSDPRAELDLVARILAPGSYLLLELPDPACLIGRALGPLWTPCHTLQHLHLMPLRNLLSALTARGLTPVRVQRREAHMPIDITCAVLALGQWAGPDPRLPWLAEPNALARFRHRTVTRALPRAVRVAYAVDQKLAPVLRATGTGNVYRVLARRSEKGSG